jgi:hypothetical protein
VVVCRQDGIREGWGQIFTDCLLMGGFAFMALRSVRNVAWFLLLVPPVLGYHFQFARQLLGIPRDQRRRQFYGILAVLLGLGAVVWQVSRGGFGIGISRRKLPVRAVRYMEDHPVPGPTYNVYEWGGYLIWRRWPEARVFVDGRTLVYGDRIIRAALCVSDGEDGWQEVLERYGVRSILIRYGKRESRHFFVEGDWECVFWDDTALVAVRSGDAPSLRRYYLTNPVTFSSTFEHIDPRPVLQELDRVLDADAQNWRAWTFRSEALLKEADLERGRSAALHREAVKAARRAVHLRREAPEAWRALAAALRAAGDQKGALKAQRRAAKREAPETE